MGQRGAREELCGSRVEFRTLERDVLEIKAFERPGDYVEHFKERYGPTIAALANARRNGQEAELDEALDRFCDDWNVGTPDRARFEPEFLLAVARGREIQDEREAPPRAVLLLRLV